MRKYYTLLTAFVFVLLLNTTALATEPQTFADVPADSPYYDAVEYMHERGIVNGYGDGRFHPDERITAEQFWAIFLRSYFPEECATMLPNDTDMPYTALIQTLGLSSFPENRNAQTYCYFGNWMVNYSAIE